MDPDRFGQVKTEANRIKRIVGHFINTLFLEIKTFIRYFNLTLFTFLIKFIVLVFFIFIIAPIIIWIFSQTSIVVHPLVIGEIGSSQNFSEEPITELLCFDLQRIKNIHEQGPIKRNLSFKSPALTHTAFSGSGISGFTAEDVVLTSTTHPSAISTITPEIHSIGFRISQLGNVAASGISLPLGQIIIAFKELTHNQGQTITCSLQKYGSNLCMVAILDDPESYGGAFETRRTITKNNSSFEDLIPGMIEDISFQIAHHICMKNLNSKNLYPQTWQSFRNFTRGMEAYYMYNITGNVIDLDRSSRMILLAKKSEPHCMELDNMLLNLGLENLNIDRYNESIFLFRTISKSQPSINYRLEDAAAAWKNKAIYLFSQEKLKDSIQAFDMAIELNPEYAEAWNNKGLVLYLMHKYNESIKAFDMAIELDPEYAEARNNKGLVLSSVRRYNESLQAFDMAIELDPEYAEAWNNKGLVLSSVRRYNESLEAFDMAIELNPEYAEAWNNKGLSLYLMHKYNESLQAFDMVIKLNSIQDKNSGSIKTAPI